MNRPFTHKLGRAALVFAALFSLLATNIIAASATTVGSGTYDDSHANWVYTGSWTAYSGLTGPYLGTKHSSSDLAATASFTFSGTSFVFTYITNTNRGNIQVWVDGVQIATINANGTLHFLSTYTSPTFTPGTHTVVFKHGGPSGMYIDVDAIQIFAKFDDPDPAWTYAGSWSTYSGLTGPYLGTKHSTSDLAATASFTFSGTGFIFTYITNSNRGNIQVWLDGSQLTTINANGSLHFLSTYTSPSFASGTHTVVFKHGGPSNTYIDVDALQILGGGLATDSLAPGLVANLLAATSPNPSAIYLTWNAPPDDAGDNGSGPVAAYLVRVSTSIISTETDWDNATAIISGIPTPPLSPGGAQSMTVSGLIPDTSYSVAVRGQDEASNLGPIAAYNAVSSLSVIPNDDFGTPISVASLPFTQTIDNVTFATTGIDDPQIPNCNSDRGLYTLWYSYNPSETQQLQIDTIGSGYDTVLAVWTGTRGNLAPVACNDQLAPGNSQSKIKFEAHSGTQYYIEVAQFRDVAAGGSASAQSSTTLVLNIQTVVASGIGPGIYDDADPAWTYTGSWTAYSGLTGPYLGTKHSTSSLAATASFTFTGTSFIFTYNTNSNRGNIQVWVDGSQIATINAYSASLVWQKTYTSPSYPLGEHTVVFKHGGPSGTYIDTDAIRILAKYDDADPAWTYAGAWTGYSGLTGPYLGTKHSTSDLAATASFTFSGTGFIFTYNTNSNRGKIQVWVDGSQIATINAYSATLVWQKTYTSPNYALGIHTVVFKHGGASGTYIDTDALTIQ